MINLDQIVEAHIKSVHGWAVAEQFEATFNGESFEEQNYNAMNYIFKEVGELLRSDLFNEDVQDELQDYWDRLELYLSESNQ